MKPIRRTDSSSQSCSCTSCLYKSESEQPSIKKYILHGSRIDRLYYGKYIPLRERKLLNRLVRTRAVYDDLRARLISDSTLSLDKSPDLRPRKHHHAIKTLESTEKRGAILELVDYIDKGGLPDQKKLSECCSCCSCSSKIKISEFDRKEHKHKRPYIREYEGQYGEHVHTGMRERYNKTGVRFKAKHIRSDPCTCTFKFSGLIKKGSKALIKKIHSVPLEQPTREQYITKASKLQSFGRKSYHKYKNMQEKLDRDIKKLNESRENVKKSLRLHAKKSLKRMKQAKHKFKANIESGLKKSAHAIKSLHRNEPTFESPEFPEDETKFEIKKDSIVKFKDYLKRKQMLKDWECDLECIPDTCVPEQCFKIIKLRRSHKRQQQRDRKFATEYKMINRDIKVGRIPVSRSSTSVQAEQFGMTTSTNMKKQRPILHVENEKVKGQRMIIETKEVIKPGMKQGIEFKTILQQKKMEKSVGPSSLASVTSRKEKAVGNIKETRYIRRQHGTSQDKEHVKIGKSDTSNRQVVRIGSSFSFDVEFSKKRPDSKTSNQPSYTEHVPGGKRKKVRRHHKISQVVLKPRFEATEQVLIESKVKPKKHETKMMQTRNLVKHLSAVKTNTDYEAKSVSSETNKIATADKSVSKEMKIKESLLKMSNDELMLNVKPSYSKQAVRIRSTFSFNVEFYKTNDQNEVKTHSIKEEVMQRPNEIDDNLPKRMKQKIKKQSHSRSSSVLPKVMNVKSLSVKSPYVKSKYIQAKTTLTKCLCWSKIHKLGKTKRKIKNSSTGTMASLTPETKVFVPSTADKNIETKKAKLSEVPQKYEILPYECEPGFCIPGECDPLVCNKFLQMRNRKLKKLKSKGSYTSSRKTRSTSSVVSRSVAPRRAKVVQSSITATKVHKTTTPRKHKKNIKLRRNELNANEPGRQAVRIGSNFSFNIEFYKNKPTPVNVSKTRVSSTSKEVSYKPRNLKKNQYQQHNKILKPMHTQITGLERNLLSLKRCICTLKLYKNKNTRQNKLIEVKTITADTQTIDEAYPMVETFSKSTKTHWKPHRELLPFECEPYFCIPGECDPNMCLQNIKRRMLDTKDYGMFTDRPKMISMLSFTENPYKRSTAILAHPKLYRRGTNVNKNDTKFPRDINGPRDIAGVAGKSLLYTSSKQAVRIGSSFDFTIQFSKQLPEAVTVTKQPITKQTAKYRDKNIKVTKVMVDHANTQSEAKKVHRALLVRPMLKRCFCTLNLQKKTKQPLRKGPWPMGNKYFTPKIYTVSTAMTNKTELISQQNIEEVIKSNVIGQKKRMISISTSSFLFKNCVSSVDNYSNLQLNHALKIPVGLKQPIKITSNLSMEIKFIRKYCLPETCNCKCPVKSFSYACMDGKLREQVNGLSQVSRPDSAKLTFIDQYLERCYYIMNVQILRGKDTRMKAMNRHLKPYECEQGVCIPGECDPYECQKLIMKRLMRNVHRGSSTNSTNKSISSYATYSESGTKSTQYKTDVRNRTQELGAKTYKPKKLVHEPNQKQAVRIGSTFSFDIEFAKRHLSKKKYKQYVPSKYNEGPIKRKRNKVTSEGSQGSVNFGTDRQMQSNASLADKSFNYAPMMKRCFCTLKLQKRGRMNKYYKNLYDTPIRKPSRTTSRSIKVGTMKTKYKGSPRLDIHNLKSYECEPGICIPGKCNPYECLELMTNRKNFGMNAAGFGSKSISSMTSEGSNFKRKHRNRAAGVKLKKVNHKTMKRNKDARRVVEPKIQAPNSRQVVRIGSNFSFNVEFFKDKPQVSEFKDTFKTSKKTNRSDGLKRQKRHRKYLKNSLSQSSVSVNHGDTQVITHTIERPTMTTSFLRRCFCTAKLHGIRIPKQQNTLKFERLPHSRNKGTNDVPNNVYSEVLTADKYTITDQRQRFHALPLEAYECEPGICIPGQCNPYLCDKIIQQRLLKQHSRASGTESVNMYSVSSSSGYRKRRKNDGTQSRIIKQYTYNQHIKGIPTDKTSSYSTDKRLVRIGSNFSFNVEFYKENVDSSTMKETSKGITEIETEMRGDTTRNIPYKRMRTTNHRKNAGTESVPSVRNNNAQVKHKKVKKFGVSPIKRCYCTLKLLNKHINKGKIVNKEDTKNITTNRTVGTQLHSRLVQDNLPIKALAPYECEPFTCVPGECDPTECFERIRRRRNQTKDFGIVTKYPKRRSVGSFPTRIRRDENLQAGYTRARPNKAIQKTSYMEEPKLLNTADHARQAVRIGSNFSFNIEFFKDSESTAQKQVTNMFPEQFSVGKSSNKYHTKPQQSHNTHDAYSQVANKIVRSSATNMSGLKRCFCTLQLKNKDHRKYDNPKLKDSPVGKFLKNCICALKKNKAGKGLSQPPAPALNYEVKGTSTYSSNAKQNKIKPVRILAPYECEPYTCVPGECDPYECWERIKKTRVRHFGTDYKRHLKDTATNSINTPVTVCTKVQCPYKRRVRSQTTSYSKRRQDGREATQFSSDPFQNRNRQAVRIGSNFSFNIEFFKDHASKNSEAKEIKKFKSEKVTDIRRTPRKLQTKFKGSGDVRTNLRSQGSQSPFLKRQFVNSVSNTAPKRCFCTLNLFNEQNNFKPKIESLTSPKLTEDKMTATKNKYMVHNELSVYECPPFMCIPGDCDPYECLDKMKRRGIIRKSQSVGTRAEKTSIASVGSRTMKLRGHKAQVKPLKKRKYTSPLYSEQRSLPTSQYVGKHNKRAVRIGSNFNFNIEFFKQKSQPAVIRKQIVRARDKGEDSKSYLSKTVPAKAGKFRHHYLQVDGTKVKDQASDAGNTLKRCFCTLQLQKSMAHRPKRKNELPPGINVKYPQVITVGRVAIEPFNKNLIKNQRLRNVNAVRRSTSTDPKLLTDYRNVATKTDKKYLRNKDLLVPCNPSNCPDYSKKNILGKATKMHMDTILPYTPSKFNKKQSKTILLAKDKIKKTRDHDDTPHDISILDRGKRLSAKRSKKSIPAKKLKGGLSNSFLCRCAKLFFKSTETSPKMSDKQGGTDKEHPFNVKLTVVPKKSKGIKLTKQTVDENRSILNSKYIDNSGKKNTRFQRGNGTNKIENSQSTENKYFKNQWKNNEVQDRQSTSEERRKPNSKLQKTRVTFADNTKSPDIGVPTKNSNQLQYHKPNTRALCYSCSENNCPLQSHNRKSGQEKRGVFGLLANCLVKHNKKPVTHSESADDCQYCECCKRKIDVDEISKGAGDRRSTISSKNKGGTTICPCSKDYVHSNENRASLREKLKTDTLSHKFPMKKKKCCSKPLLEMQVDSVNYAIVNKNQVKDQLKIYNGKKDTPPRDVKPGHNDSCICCKCIKKRQVLGAKILVPAKGTSSVPGPVGKLFPSKKTIPVKPVVHPCVCGSKKCAKEAKKQAKKPQIILRVQHGKRCVCGSTVCRKETEKMKETQELICKCEETMAKRIIMRKKRKELERRLKIDKEKEEIRRRKRIKRNRELERRVKKYKNASDILLAADSLIDLGKLSLTTITGALRTAAKALYDPQVALESMKLKKTDPESIVKQLEQKYMESDAASTARRLKMRCLFMKRVQDAKEKLEENPVTHFLMHVADKNAKTRKFKRKPVRRVREPLDFNCSLYMASLRRRPHLNVYYKWPWFYPHFITMLNIWKQFTDIALFLLAAVVWSPCILCMEGCRAMMCCFFCTG